MRPHLKRSLSPLGLVALLMGAACTSAAEEKPGAEAAASFECLNPPAVDSGLPGDSPITDQASLNCFAWQEFIALNWPSAGAGEPAPVPATDFGKPGSTAPVVWETYMDTYRIFRPDGGQPAAWGSRPEVPPACRDVAGDVAQVYSHTSKFSIRFNAPGALDQAFPGSSPAWLADRDGNPVLYEIVVDRDEYDFIVGHGFFNAKTQYDKVSAGKHVDLPRGAAGGETGSIELKAAWLVVGDPDDDKWRRFKLSRGLVYDESDESCSVETLALVGLHILHKTTSQPQWVWATFEQVDNAPDQSAVDAGGAGDDYTFYRARCEPQPVPAACQTLAVGFCKPTGQTTTSCTPNTSPAYCLDLHNSECPPYPVQVTRQLPIPDQGDNLLATLNDAVRQLIRDKAGADSVWQHYQLVGVLWSDSPVDENTKPQPPLTPLSVSGMRPDPNARPVANTTLETYVQSATCIACHRYATLAWPHQESQRKGDKPAALKSFATDYSFVFQDAGPPLPPE